jgi:hypothetical protein
MSISVSTLADYVGHGAVLLRGLVDLIEAHILAGERIHHDDTTVPVMAAGKTITGRIWASVRDDRPFGGTDPPAVCYYYTRDRTGAHIGDPTYGGANLNASSTTPTGSTRIVTAAANETIRAGGREPRTKQQL